MSVDRTVLSLQLHTLQHLKDSVSTRVLMQTGSHHLWSLVQSRQQILSFRCALTLQTNHGHYQTQSSVIHTYSYVSQLSDVNCKQCQPSVYQLLLQQNMLKSISKFTYYFDRNKFCAKHVQQSTISIAHKHLRCKFIQLAESLITVMI